MSTSKITLETAEAQKIFAELFNTSLAPLAVTKAIEHKLDNIIVEYCIERKPPLNNEVVQRTIELKRGDLLMPYIKENLAAAKARTAPIGHDDISAQRSNVLAILARMAKKSGSKLDLTSLVDDLILLLQSQNDGMAAAKILLRAGYISILDMLNQPQVSIMAQRNIIRQLSEHINDSNVYPPLIACLENVEPIIRRAALNAILRGSKAGIEAGPGFDLIQSAVRLSARTDADDDAREIARRTVVLWQSGADPRAIKPVTDRPVHPDPDKPRGEYVSGYQKG